MTFTQAICIPITKPREMAMDEYLALVCDVGFTAVEIWGRGDDFDSLVKSCGSCKLTLASMVGHNGAAEGLNNPANHDRIEKELRESIRIATDVGMTGVICFSGNRQSGQSEGDAIKACADGLLRVADFAGQNNINLNLELLNSKRDHKGYQCDHTAWGLRVCELANHPRVKLLYDIYHMQIMEGDVIQTLRNAIVRIGHIHTAGVPGRGNLDDTQELNYPAIARALCDLNYSGVVGHEFKPVGDLRTALRQALDAMRT